MRNKGRVKLVIRAVLIGASSGLVVKVGIRELVTLILLFCGMLHLSRGLEERDEVMHTGAESNTMDHRGRQGEVEGRCGSGGLLESRQNQEYRGEPRRKEGRSEADDERGTGIHSLEKQEERAVEIREEL